MEFEKHILAAICRYYFGLWFDQFDQYNRNIWKLNNIYKVRFEFHFYYFVCELLKTIKVETDLKSAYSQQLVFSRKKGNVIFVIRQTGWNSLVIRLVEWLKLIANNKTNNGNSTKQNKWRFRYRQNLMVFFSSYSGWEKCRFLRKWNNKKDITNIATLFEWYFREQEYLKCENGIEMESTCCL